ncbi:amidase [Nocardia yunnanensis]|uniref:Amidase n=1 Tax=Nocardia yunnanensis TaxID=2382165 RepID=A0A386ZBE6_9NOCA|nr:amidase [Nocardia yunnanensis]AYF74816.1 amidase [Nocardia yunnanensis]
MEWSFRAAEELSTALRSGAVSSVELTEEAIARIERDDKAINAICVPDFERARAAAQRADRALADGVDLPLLGIPVTVKESYNMAGLPTTWGLPQHRDFIPDQDAEQVARLAAAGAVMLGKTNVPLMLQDWQSYNDIYGTTNNPWDHGRSPGGSSGGSAAALAAGFGALSIGSDIAGSLRVPAHFCGIYAHKPTLGLVSTRGMVPPPLPPLPTEADLAVAGPMARTARDLTLLLDVMAGPDPLTRGLAYRLELPAPRHESLSEFRVLIVEEHPLVPTGSAVRAALGRVADALTAEGARVQHHSALLPDLTEAAELYIQLLVAGFGAGMPAERYEQLRAAAAALPADAQGIDTAWLRGATATHRDFLVAAGGRERHRHQWRALFGEFDVVICPIGPTPAFPHDQNPDVQARRLEIDGAAYPYGDQLHWPGVATMPGLPATAIPAGLSPDGLPVGVQLIGPMYEDRTPLRLAELLEARIGGFQPPA